MKRLIYLMPNGGVAITAPAGRREGEPEAVWLDRVARKCCPEGGKLVAVVSPDDLPSREHRDAWVWDGQRVVVDESRIKPKATVERAEGAAPAYDSRLDALAKTVQDAIEQMRAEVHKIRDEILHEAERRFRAGLEAIAVISRVQAQEPIDLDAVPALVSEVKAEGLPVTEESVIAVADRHAARIYQITAGRA